MEQDRLDELIFINNNSLYARFQTRKLNNNDEDFDPICVDKLNYSSEWMMGILRAANEFMYGKERFTWTHVDVTIGASKTHADRVRRLTTQV